MLNAKQVRDFHLFYQDQQTMGLAIINLDVSVLDSTVLDFVQPKLQLNEQGQLVKVQGQNPYASQRLFAYALLGKRHAIQGQELRLSMQGISWLNSTKAIEQMDLSLNGQSLSLIEEGSWKQQTATFSPLSQDAQMLLTITFSDGSQFSDAIPLSVSAPTNSSVQSITASEPFTCPSDYNYGDNMISRFGKGEYKVFLAEGHTNIQKPYILVDGFDPHDQRKIDFFHAEEYDYGDAFNENGDKEKDHLWYMSLYQDAEVDVEDNIL